MARVRRGQSLAPCEESAAAEQSGSRQPRSAPSAPRSHHRHRGHHGRGGVGHVAHSGAQDRLAGGHRLAHKVQRRPSGSSRGGHVDHAGRRGHRSRRGLHRLLRPPGLVLFCFALFLFLGLVRLPGRRMIHCRNKTCARRCTDK